MSSTQSQIHVVTHQRRLQKINTFRCCFEDQSNWFSANEMDTVQNIYVSCYINPYYSHANWLILKFFFAKKKGKTTKPAFDNVLMTSPQAKK